MPSERFAEAVKEYVEKLGGIKAYSARRLKCQTDLWFLSKEIFHRDLFERTHRPVVSFFLKKKPFAPAFREGAKYTLGEFHEAIGSLAPLAERKGLLIYPRGTYKSSIDADNVTQYIICYPDIRVLCLVGESSLGEGYVSGIKRRFVLEKGREPTEFQLLFPDFIVDLETDKDRGGENEYWCPLRKLDQQEATLGTLSILGSTSGWHCDVLDCNDIINDTTPVKDAASRKKILRKFLTVSNLLDPHGILELNGTRYHEEDAYAHIEENLKGIRYLHGSSWTPLPHAKDKKLKDLTEQDVVLLFPEKQDFAFLREKLLLDEETFCLQQLNAPQKIGPSVKFKLEDLRRATTRVPQNPSFRRYNFWDVATSDSEGSDYTAGGFLSIDTQKWTAYLHVLIVDKFTPSELAFQIAKLAKETMPERVFFEKYKDTAELWLEQEVKGIGVTMGYDIPVHAFKTDKTKMAKGHRICGLEPLITGGRLFFSNLIPNLDMLYKQFMEFKGVPHPKRHDDIPDMLSFLRMVMPMVGTELPRPADPRSPVGLQVLTNEKENQAWQEAQRKNAAVQAFLHSTTLPLRAVQPTVRPEGYFPGQ
jgi:phage terminase large subunit-like protein